MESYKNELEDRIRKLTFIYKDMIFNLGDLHKLLNKQENDIQIMKEVNFDQEDIKKRQEEHEITKSHYAGFTIILDCVNYRLNDMKNDLVKVYNNEPVDLKPEFRFIPELIPESENDCEEKKNNNQCIHEIEN